MANSQVSFTNRSLSNDQVMASQQNLSVDILVTMTTKRPRRTLGPRQHGDAVCTTPA